ncbi:MAG: acetylglutamate kinase, partial [Pseudomonadota bacterium]|nr:acetylglutamate kinase [Pseudomonadota bacterium]
QASKYLILTNTNGILDEKGDLIQSINAKKVKSLIQNKIISGGMLPKIESALEAVSSGVDNVQIINGTIDHSVLLELFTDEGIGTMIRR